MKNLILLSAFALIANLASAQTNVSSRYQNGYYKPSSGTYVQPHYKTTTNSTNWDNSLSIERPNALTNHG